MTRCRTLFFCLLLPAWGAAVRPYVPKIADPVLEPWRWRQEEALNNLGVLCMDEAEDGSLWFGNVGSIARYDGTRVTQIPFDDELLSRITHHKTLPWAKALLALPDGRLLVLIGESLVLRADDQWTVIIQDAGRSNFSACLRQAGDGTFWLLVPDALWRISSDLMETSVVMKPSENGSLDEFCIDRPGNLWVIERTGERFRLITIPVENGLPKPDRREFPVPFQNSRTGAHIIAGRDGLIWYGSGSDTAGLESFDSRKGEWIVRKEKQNNSGIYSLLEDRNGKIWAGTEGEILCASNREDDVLYSRAQLRLPRTPLSLFETRDGRIWVIGRIGYVYSADVEFSEWMTYEGLNFCCESPDGIQWFISRGILVVSHDPRSGTWRQYKLSDGLIDKINALICSSQGLIWIAGSHEDCAALAVFDGTRWTRFCHPEFALWIEPNAVFEAADGTVWFGAGGKVLADTPNAGGALQYKVNEDRSVELVKHHAPPAFPYYVTAFEQTPDKALWVGSTLIHRYEDVSLPARTFPEIQGGNTVAMTLDQDQTLWVAKAHFGVCRWQDDSWTVFSTKDGLASLLLSDLLSLDDGSILASSERGISRYDGKTWTTQAYPEWFGMSRRGSSMRKSRDGSIWFNYLRGESRELYLTVTPEKQCCAIRHRMETNPPDTFITEFLKQVSPPGNTHIIWGAHDPWGSTPQKDLQYSWRLNGGEWSAFSRETGRTFLKLKSGKYVLEVRARDRVFNIDPTPARAEFTVVPPIWKQAWFVSLISVLTGSIVLLIWILIRNRDRYLRNQQAEREVFLVKQQAERETFLLKQQEEREKNLIERQREREALLMKQQEEKEQHLKELDRIKTGFFTNISHELRTPITVIAGRLQMIFDSEADNETKNSLSIALRNAQRVATLITQLLDFRKIQEGRIRVETAQGDLIPPLRDWVASLQVLAEQAQVSLSLECADACRGQFDFDKIQKIFTNLITNSIKYTKPGGEVRVCLNVEVDDCRAETVEDLSADRLEGQEPFQPCKNKTTGRRLTFTVEDSGIGISSEHLDHIFERFYRVSEASMAVGAGIGLNLAKELVDLLGGEIRAESPIHTDTGSPGTRFTVRLPIEQVTGDRCQVAGEKSQVSVEEESGEPLRPLSPLCPSDEKTADSEKPLILIVEDDGDIRDFIAEGLGSTCRLATAQDGAAGLQTAKELVPDLIITDVMMPVMDGIELCRELKTSLETSHIPVVMLTAKASLEHQMEGLKTGADDYITKPFHMVLLQTRIANLLESRRLLREWFCREYSVMTRKIPENAPDKEFIDKAMGVLQENYSNRDFKSDEFAAAMHMSSSTLHRKFKAVMNRTPAAFIHEFRMMRAAELLLNTSHTVTEISFMTGFDEPTNFTRTFKKNYKMTPSRYRAAH